MDGDGKDTPRKLNERCPKEDLTGGRLIRLLLQVEYL